MIEENDLRIAETKKNTYEFKRDIVIGAENTRTGKIMAEKMLRYMEDHVKAKDAIIEKLRLKNTTLRNQIQKMEQQLLQKVMKSLLLLLLLLLFGSRTIHIIHKFHFH